MPTDTPRSVLPPDSETGVIVDTRVHKTDSDCVHATVTHDRPVSWIRSDRENHPLRFKLLFELTDDELVEELETVDAVLHALPDDDPVNQ